MDIAALAIAVSLSLLFAVYLFLVLPYHIASRIARRPRLRIKWTPRDSGYSYEDLVFRARDGVELRGWIVRGSRSSTVIVLHGIDANRSEDYVARAIEILARNGFNVVAIDHRAHGESGGEYTTFGYRESEDVIDLINWLEKNRPELAKRIALLGFSMGGMTSLLAMSKDDRVGIAIIDSPPLRIQPGRAFLPILPRFLAKLAQLYVGVITGTRYEELDAFKHISRLRGKSILLIVGTNDPIISPEEAKRFIDEALKHGCNAELWIVNARHVLADLQYPEEYERKIVSFLEKRLY